jgi:hypothetical protein
MEPVMVGLRRRSQKADERMDRRGACPSEYRADDGNRGPARGGDVLPDLVGELLPWLLFTALRNQRHRRGTDGCVPFEALVEAAF